MLSTEQSMKEYNLDTITCPIHSFETFGAVDGPGIRFVIFTQGCNLKCKYCQNRDTWCHQGGTAYSVRQVLNKIERYKNYIIPSGGGVTVSGGEPLLHLEFLTALFKELKKQSLPKNKYLTEDYRKRMKKGANKLKVGYVRAEEQLKYINNVLREKLNIDVSRMDYLDEIKLANKIKREMNIQQESVVTILINKIKLLLLYKIR